VIDAAVRNPYTVAVGVLLIIIFGLLAAFTIPVQLKPTLEPPQVVISTWYPGTNPVEVEDQITRRLEKELNSLNNLKQMTSTSSTGSSSIFLLFNDGTDRDVALIDTVKAMERVGDLPDEAFDPVVTQTTMEQADHIMWMQFYDSEDPDNLDSLNDRADLMDETLEAAFLRLNGVGSIDIFGGLEREILIEPDPIKMNAFDVSVDELSQAIAMENRNVRGGYLDEGKLERNVRTIGRYQTLDDIENTIVKQTGGGRVRVSDVARVVDGRARRTAIVAGDGHPIVALGFKKQTGANTLSTIQNISRQAEQFNQEFEKSGIPYRFEIVYSQEGYISDAIKLVLSSVGVGALLVVLVLFLFLRGARPIGIVLTAIPVSMVFVFLILAGLHRTVNIISLAGIAFSVGMIIDNAIVVLENIDRHMKEFGKTPLQAAFDGSKEVWGAVLASTLTTLAVFIPIILNTTEAGELFKDIAIAIVSAIGMSLIVSLTVIPTMASLVLKRSDGGRELSSGTRLMLAPLNWLDRIMPIAAAFSKFYDGFLDWLVAQRERSLLGGRTSFLTAVFIFFLVSLWLLPSANYLPNGTMNFIFCFARPVLGQRAEVTDQGLQQLVNAAKEDETVNHVFSVAAPIFNGVGIGLHSDKSSDMALNMMIGKMFGAGAQVPGFEFIYPFRASIFQTQDKQFSLEIIGPDLDVLKKVSNQLQQALGARLDLVENPQMGGIQTDFREGVPELHVKLDRNRLADLGLTVTQVSRTVEAMLSGVEVSKFTDKGQEYDIFIRGNSEDISSRRVLGALSIKSPLGRTVRLDEIADIQDATGPSSIRHYNRQRSIQLTVQTNEDLATQTVLDKVEAEVISPIRAELPPNYNIRYGESADKLRDTISSLTWQALLAMAIVYLLMVSLFRSWGLPLVIMVTVPLAWSGSFINMALASYTTGQMFSLTTVLFFSIVLGVALLALKSFLRPGGSGIAVIGVIAGLAVGAALLFTPAKVFLDGIGMMLSYMFNKGGQIQFDVLGMLGLIILSGIVVNNAILIVHQTLNQIGAGLSSSEALRSAAKSRLRPIAMSTCTSVFGMLPLALGQGSGSELYRGLGVIIVGGLTLSTVFTLFVVPIILSLVLRDAPKRVETEHPKSAEYLA